METFQSGLYKELTVLRDERDLLIWQISKQNQTIYSQQTQIEAMAESLSKMKEQVISCEETEKSLIMEI